VAAALSENSDALNTFVPTAGDGDVHQVSSSWLDFLILIASPFPAEPGPEHAPMALKFSAGLIVLTRP
jgi:hypothetical protein